MWIGNVIIYRGLAYVPTMHVLGTGGWYTGEPVTVAPVEADELARVLEKTRRAGNPPISATKVALSADPILRSTGAVTWGRLALHAASYEIDWSENEVLLTMSMLDERGHFVPDPEKTRRLQPESTCSDLAALIVQDWQARLDHAAPA